jgi:hypothetical protein
MWVAKSRVAPQQVGGVPIEQVLRRAEVLERFLVEQQPLLAEEQGEEEQVDGYAERGQGKAS